MSLKMKSRNAFEKTLDSVFGGKRLEPLSPGFEVKIEERIIKFHY